MEFVVNRGLGLAVALSLGLALFSACDGGGGGAPADDDAPPADVEAEGGEAEAEDDADPLGDCVVFGCDDSLVCDAETGWCRPCRENAECARDEPGLSGVPVCDDGVCRLFGCPALTMPARFPSPEPGSTMPLPQLGSDRRLIVQRSRFFPLGLEAVPDDQIEGALLGEAAAAGYTFFTPASPCCGTTEQLNVQLRALDRARTAGLYGVVKSFDPPFQVADPGASEVLQAIQSRANTTGLLLWLGFEHPSVVFVNAAQYRDYWGKMTAALADMDNVNKRPVAVSDLPGAETDRLNPDAVVVWPTLPLDPAEAFAEFSALRDRQPGMFLWARLPAVPASVVACLKAKTCPPAQPVGEEPSVDRLRLLGVTALAAGADGLVVWGLEASSYTAGAARWTALQEVGAWFADRSKLWMAEAPAEPVGVEGEGVVALQRLDEKLLWLFLANLGPEPREAILTLPGAGPRWCLAEPADELLTLTEEALHRVTVPGYGVARVALAAPQRL